MRSSSVVIRGSILGFEGDRLKVRTSEDFAVELHMRDTICLVHDHCPPRGLNVAAACAAALCGEHVLLGRARTATCGASDDLLAESLHIFPLGERGILSQKYWRSYAGWLGQWWLNSIAEPGEWFPTDIPGPETSDTWVYVHSRTVFGLSVAFALTGRADFLRSARAGARLLAGSALRHGSHFVFPERIVKPTFAPVFPALVNVFGQIYALTGLIAAAAITQERAIIDVLRAGLRSIAVTYRDDAHGGFYDAVCLDSAKPVPGITDSKSFNSIVDPLSAAFLLTWEMLPSLRPEVLSTITGLVELMPHRLMSSKHAFIRERFYRDWSFGPPLWDNPYNSPDGWSQMGLNLKTAWVLVRAAKVVPDWRRSFDVAGGLLAAIRASGGEDRHFGGWYDLLPAATPLGAKALDHARSAKVWWQQEEGILANSILHLATGDADAFTSTVYGLAFFLAFFVDWHDGGVRFEVTPCGVETDATKGSWLKGGYHELELAWFLTSYFAALSREPVHVFGVQADDHACASNHPIPPAVPSSDWKLVAQELAEFGTCCYEFVSFTENNSREGT